MRVLFVLNKPVVDGPNRVMLSVARYLAESRKLPVDVIFLRGEEQQDLEVAQQIRVIRSGNVDSTDQNWARSQMGKLQNFQATHAIFSLARPIIQALPAARGFQIPHRIAVNHGIHELDEAKIPGFAARWLFGRSLRCATQLVSVSKYAETQLLNHKLWSGGGHHVIYNGVPVPEEIDLPAEGPFLFSAGNLRRVKGYDLLLQAMAQVVKRIPNARLEIAGDGPERRRLDQMCRKLKVDSNVRFLGHVQDLTKHYQNQPIYVQPSRSESFGLAAVDAMAHGCPLIAFRETGLAEVAGSAARLAPTGSSSALAEAIIDLVTNQTERQRLAHLARKHVMSHLTEAVMHEKYYRLLVGRTDVL